MNYDIRPYADSAEADGEEPQFSEETEREPQDVIDVNKLLENLEQKQQLKKRYIAHKKIGEGGLATVYRAEQSKTGQHVAIKVDKRSLKGLSSINVKQEVELLAALNHPRIPRLLDFHWDFDADVAYTVMEFIEGDDLRKKLKRQQAPFSQAQVLDWAFQLFDVLSYLHRNDYVHGDIKPSNIILKPDGALCLIDFNIARNLEGKQSVYVDTRKKSVSPADYGSEAPTMSAPPEVPTDKAQDMGTLRRVSLNKRLDIQMLGKTLYQLLTGVWPKGDGDSDAQLLYDNMSSKEAANVILTAINPNRCYQTVEEMASALRKAPYHDSRNRRFRALKLLYLLPSLTLLTGLALVLFSVVVQYQSHCEDEMYKAAQQAEAFLKIGDFESARVSALKSVQRQFLAPPPSAYAQGDSGQEG